ncbi:universal stress protein [uncultured Phycicoccus sp.]|uniref:universal stress protein n=1 Tax=uncultured Phycicoccus sp. TaxID=661422 RepID=UPI002614E639|nr:universal stress protein [uncultured Phycicoccus sp.]
MGTWEYFAVAIWIGTGLITGLWMARRGHDWRWTPIAVALGPLFVPIALERVERRPRVVRASGDELPPRPVGPDGPRVLVGIDGSAESDAAVQTAVTLLRPVHAPLVLAEVVSYDEADPQTPAAVEAAEANLREAALTLGDLSVNLEVLAGPPGEALRRYATEHDMDVIVVGRRGRGLSERVLGGVSTHLLRHSEVPVLVVEPSTSPTAPAPSAG